MSLIDEALKRAQAKHQGEKTQAEPDRWVPTPMPDPWRGGRRRVLLISAGALLVLLLGGAALLLLRGRPSPRSAGEVEGRRAAAPAHEPKVTFLPEAVVPPPEAARAGGAAPGEAQPRIAASPARGRELAVRPVERKGPTQGAAGSPLPSGEGPVARGDLPAESTERPRPDVRTFAGEAVLPGGATIELGGIVYSQEKPVALLNGKVLGPGAFVEGYTVVRIEPDRVELADATNEKTRIVIVLR